MLNGCILLLLWTENLVLYASPLKTLKRLKWIGFPQLLPPSLLLSPLFPTKVPFRPYAKLAAFRRMEKSCIAFHFQWSNHNRNPWNTYSTAIDIKTILNKTTTYFKYELYIVLRTIYFSYYTVFITVLFTCCESHLTLWFDGVVV